jgi:integrase
MNGSISYDKDRAQYCVNWYQGKTFKIRRYKGEFMYDRRIAEKCLALIQGRYEQYQKGLCDFRIEEFTGKGWSNTLEFYREWMKDVVEPGRKPNTIKGYWSYYKNWIEPFFKEYPVMLHEIQIDTLTKLKNYIKLEPKGKYNVINALHCMMDYAHRAKKISAIPPFPKKGEYSLKKPDIKYLSSSQQDKIFNEIPERIRPIFLFLKYHYRRPSEACALQWRDYDEINNAFVIRRTFSNKKLVESTKTNAIHTIPCDDRFSAILIEIKKAHDSSAGKGTDFIFKNPIARKEGKHFDLNSLDRAWDKACKKAGVEGIDLYQGTKHTACVKFINEDGGSIDDLQALTDHANRNSLYHYTFVGLERKRQLMRQGKVVELPQNSPKEKRVNENNN